MKWFIRRCYLFFALLSVAGSFCADEPSSISSFVSRCRARYELVKKRAKKWYGKHKVGVKRAVGVGALAGVATLLLTKWYFSGGMLPLLQNPLAWSSITVGNSEYEGIERKINDHIVLKQIRVQKQTGFECGYHAVKNMLLLCNMHPTEGEGGFLKNQGEYERDAFIATQKGGAWRKLVEEKRASDRSKVSEWTDSDECKSLLAHVCEENNVSYLMKRLHVIEPQAMHANAWFYEIPSSSSNEKVIPFLLHVDGNHWIAMVRHVYPIAGQRSRVEYIIADSFKDESRLDNETVKRAVNQAEGHVFEGKPVIKIHELAQEPERKLVTIS